MWLAIPFAWKWWWSGATVKSFFLKNLFQKSCKKEEIGPERSGKAMIGKTKIWFVKMATKDSETDKDKSPVSEL